MKRLDFYYFLTVALVAAVLFLPTHSEETKRIHPRITPPELVTHEQRATHFLNFKDEEHSGLGRSLGVCSGTAIGPHALMTAVHCLDTNPTSLTMDYSTETHRILSVAGDGRDHAILLLDGTPFKNIEVVDPAVSTVPENLHVYAVGGGVYPPQLKVGVTTECQDPSDVDEAAQIMCSSLPVIPGDSGAAIYNDKGKIVGLITYSVSDALYTNINFALDFTQKQYEEAASFDGLMSSLPDVPAPVTKTTAKKKRELTLFDLFGGSEQ